MYLSQHPELKYRDIIREATDMIGEDNDAIIQMRKDKVKVNEYGVYDGLTEYDISKKMTVQAMETYRLFYGKLMGE